MSRLRDYPPRIRTISTLPHIQEFCTLTHTGTHIDAPVRFQRGGKSIDELPLDLFVRKGAILSIQKSAGEEITIKDIQQAKPKVQREEILFIRTDWGLKWRTGEYYIHPYLSEEAAQWITTQGIPLFGMDTPTPELPLKLRGKDYRAPVHNALLKHNVLIAENLYLEGVAGKRVRIYALPIKIKRGDAGFARIVAELR